jgi:hypothetical protein
MEVWVPSPTWSKHACNSCFWSRSKQKRYSLTSPSFPQTQAYPFIFPVHSLRPADIQVVASLGDSLTVRTSGPWVGWAWLGVPGPTILTPGTALLFSVLPYPSVLALQSKRVGTI